MYNIEKNFHNIWITRDHRGKALPETAVYNVRHNMAIGRDWRHIIWTNSPKKIYDGLLKILPSIPNGLFIKHTSELSAIINQLGFSDFFSESASGRNPNFAQIVDLLKFIVLYEYGGVVVDCPDTYSFSTRQFGDLLCEYGILFYGSAESEAGHEIMAAAKGCQILIDYLDFMKRRIFDFKTKKSHLGKFKTPRPSQVKNSHPQAKFAAPNSRSRSTSVSSSASFLDRHTDFVEDRFDDIFSDHGDWHEFADRRGLEDFDDYEEPEDFSRRDDEFDANSYSDPGFRNDFDVYDDDYQSSSIHDSTPDRHRISQYDEYRVTNSRREETINLTGPTAVNVFLDQFMNAPGHIGRYYREKFYFEVAQIHVDEEVLTSPLQYSRLMIGIKMMGERFGRAAYVKFGKLQGGAAGSWNRLKFYSSDDTDITRF